MKYGIRGHDVKREGIANIAARMKEIGFEYIQLVLERSAQDFKVGSYGDGYADAYAKEIKHSLGDIKIAVLGSYINPSALDENVRRSEIEKFKEKIRLAKVLNPIAVGTETGFFGSTQSDEANNSEEAYAHLLKTMSEIAAYAKEMGVNIAIEGVSIFVINSPEKMARIVKDLEEYDVKVIFDPVNYLNVNNCLHQDDIINKAFELFADKIIAIHAKDFVYESGKFSYPDPGLGDLNYKLIFENMKKYNVDPPIIMEGIDEERSILAFERLKEIQSKIN